MLRPVLSRAPLGPVAECSGRRRRARAQLMAASGSAHALRLYLFGKRSGAQMRADARPRPQTQAPRGQESSPYVRLSGTGSSGASLPHKRAWWWAHVCASTISRRQVGPRRSRRRLMRPETSARAQPHRAARTRPSCAAPHAPRPPTAKTVAKRLESSRPRGRRPQAESRSAPHHARNAPVEFPLARSAAPLVGEESQCGLRARGDPH